MLKEEELNSIKSMDFYCELESTTINGVGLDYDDFGEKYDTDAENAPDYGCGDMQFIPFEKVDKNVLEKYNITQEEAKKIQGKLECLSFGCCGWCS